MLRRRTRARPCLLARHNLLLLDIAVPARTVRGLLALASGRQIVSAATPVWIVAGIESPHVARQLLLVGRQDHDTQHNAKVEGPLVYTGRRGGSDVERQRAVDRPLVLYLLACDDVGADDRGRQQVFGFARAALGPAAGPLGIGVAAGVPLSHHFVAEGLDIGGHLSELQRGREKRRNTVSFEARLSRHGGVGPVTVVGVENDKNRQKNEARKHKRQE